MLLAVIGFSSKKALSEVVNCHFHAPKRPYKAQQMPSVHRRAWFVIMSAAPLLFAQRSFRWQKPEADLE
jgi:hypothetical protein